jgi:flagellar biosynthesis chaperone FliJ
MIERTELAELGLIAKKNKQAFANDALSRIDAELEKAIKEREKLGVESPDLLRMHADQYDRQAAILEHFARNKEKDTLTKLKEAKQEEFEKVKKALMEALSVPAEFIDHLSILAKAGPEAMREGAQSYKQTAVDLRNTANQIEVLDKKITKLNKNQKYIKEHQNSQQTLLYKYAEAKQKGELLRSRGEEEYRQMLEVAEASQGKENGVSKASV